MIEPEKIRLFYVMHSNEDGADESLLVRETVLHRALKAWRTYYELVAEEGAPDEMPTRVVVVPIDPVVGAIPWDACVEVYPVPKSVRAKKRRDVALRD